MDERTKRSIKKNNERVLERMMNPEDKLTIIDPGATWYPPRPIIKKDKRALEFFSKADERRDEDT